MLSFASAARSAAFAVGVGIGCAQAHPHVFIDAGLEVIFDADGRLTHVRVSWQYDDFYSLLIAEEKKVDSDRDGNTTPSEDIWLAGFDTFWAEGYNGDLVVRLEGQDLVLSGPMDPTATMKDGRITSTHLREVTGTPLLGGDTLALKAFDPSYYTAFTMSLPVTATGSDCAVSMTEPDVDAELAQMQSMLLSIDADADLEEMDIPLIGEQFATDIRVECG